MKTFDSYQNPNPDKVTALVLIEILNCLERLEEGLKNGPVRESVSPNPRIQPPSNTSDRPANRRQARS
jgi:hypothetical protein